MLKKVSLCVFAIILLILFSEKNSDFLPVFNEEKDARLFVIMYHGVLKDESRTGKYIITPQKFEDDLIYLKENGYETISAKQLIKYVYADGELPEKPVLITFDDGMYNNYEYVLPILKKHNSYAVFSAVGSYTEEYTKSNVANSAYGYMRWCDIKELASSGYVEFGNHSYDFHSTTAGRYGTEKKKSESTLDYINAFYQDTQKMQSEFFSNCGFRPVIYTYPLGSYSKESSRVLKKMGFLITLSCTEGINKIRKGEDCLYLLKRYNRDGRFSSQEFFSRVKL